MSAQRQHIAARHTRAWRQFGLVAALVVCSTLGACTAAQTPTAAQTAEGNVAPMPFDSDIDAGTYLVTNYTMPLEITMPDGWSIREDYLLAKEFVEGKGVFVMFSNPSYVPADGCAASGPMTEVEPSIEGLADGLAASASTTTTAPVEIMVGDLRGLEFDLSVESDVDIDGCTAGHVCIHSDSASHCTRYYQGVEQRETYRVLDLNGDRAVIAVGQWENDVDPALVAEARAVFDSITFVQG
jgi:hypothetical protein